MDTHKILSELIESGALPKEIVDRAKEDHGENISEWPEEFVKAFLLSFVAVRVGLKQTFELEGTAGDLEAQLRVFFEAAVGGYHVTEGKAVRREGAELIDTSDMHVSSIFTAEAAQLYVENMFDRLGFAQDPARRQELKGSLFSIDLKTYGVETLLFALTDTADFSSPEALVAHFMPKATELCDRLGTDRFKDLEKIRKEEPHIILMMYLELIAQRMWEGTVIGNSPNFPMQ